MKNDIRSDARCEVLDLTHETEMGGKCVWQNRSTQQRQLKDELEIKKKRRRVGLKKNKNTK